MNFGPDLDIFLHVLLGMGLGGVIGLERELAGKSAGLRTHMLIGGSATLFVLLGDLIVTHFAELEANALIRSDPIRIFEAILVGVSFLGAGTIFKRDGREVEGLTTAASMLFVAAIGITVALARPLLAVALTALLLLVSLGLRWLEHLLGVKERS